MTGLRLWGASLLLNAILAAAVQWSAPAQPKFTDRLDYEWVGQHPLESGCTAAVYCYRILVPVLLEQVPVAPEARWRASRWTATTIAGAIVAVTTAGLAGGMPSAIIASLLVQGSYGFAFTAYDPYTADPWVFAILALTSWCWLANRWLAAFMVTLIGIFAKETVALISVSAALAALVSPRRHDWRNWLAQAVVVSVTLLTFRWLADTYLGWDMSQNAAAKLSSGSWLRIWWNNNPGVPLKAFFLFAPFGFGWLYAAAAVTRAPRDLQKLAIGAILPFLALNYVQNPERALGNLFFVVVPLATITLSRVPIGVGLAAAITTGLLTAKVGSSTAWLPSSSYLLIAAAASAALVAWHLRPNRSGVDDGQTE